MNEMKHDGELTPQEEPSADPEISRTAYTQLSLQSSPLSLSHTHAYTFPPLTWLSPRLFPSAKQTPWKLNCVLNEEDRFHFSTDSWFIDADVNIMQSCVRVNSRWKKLSTNCLLFFVAHNTRYLFCAKSIQSQFSLLNVHLAPYCLLSRAWPLLTLAKTLM